MSNTDTPLATTLDSATLDAHAAALTAHPPDAEAPAEPEGKRPDGPIEHLCTDVRSLWAAKEPTALAIVADIKNPQASPMQLEGAGQEKRNALIKAYREVVSDAVEMRRDLSSVEVFVQPALEEDGSRGEARILWDDYLDRLHQAHSLRSQIA